MAGVGAGKEEFQKLLEQVARGELSPAELSRNWGGANVADLGFARVDLQRLARQGVPEVVFGEGKSAAQIIGILEALGAAGQNALVTRVDADKAAQVRAARPAVEYRELGRVLVQIVATTIERHLRPVAVVTAGTSDIPVAEEAIETLRLLGTPSERFFDVGVAGIHRLLSQIERIREAPAVIVIAGMEGALPSVVGGLIQAPIVAVPTSVGYGVAFSGLTALMGMLTSCAAGVVVVNIDNGFGAAMAVQRMLSLLPEAVESP